MDGELARRHIIHYFPETATHGEARPGSTLLIPGHGRLTLRQFSRLRGGRRGRGDAGGRSGRAAAKAKAKAKAAAKIRAGHLGRDNDQQNAPGGGVVGE